MYRLLFKIDISGLPLSIAVDYAEVVIPEENIPMDTIMIQYSPITTYWNIENISWFNPWQTPGGDFDQEKTSVYALYREVERDVSLDITSLIREWHSGERGNYGILIKNLEGEFGPEVQLLENAFSNAYVRVLFSEE